MASVNKTILLGNVGKDPEYTYSSNGNLIAKFSIATSEKYNNETKTEWHNIIMFKKQAEFVKKYIKKGNTIYIEGKIQTDSWDDNEGNKRYKTNIIGNVIKNFTKKD